VSIVLESGTTIRVLSSDVALPPARTELPGIFPPDAFRNAPPAPPPAPPLMYWLKIGRSRISGPFESRSDCEQIQRLYERQGLDPTCRYER
jgi:hypothetical protein